MGRSSLFLFLFWSAAWAGASEKSLARDSYWHRLLHYRRNLLGIYRSEINDRSFFLAPNGIAIDGAGNIYVSDAGTHSIYKIVP